MEKRTEILYVRDIASEKKFYETFFRAREQARTDKGCVLTFENGSCLELKGDYRREGRLNEKAFFFRARDMDEVIHITLELIFSGYEVFREPHFFGGNYESWVMDHEHNRILVRAEMKEDRAERTPIKNFL